MVAAKYDVQIQAVESEKNSFSTEMDKVVEAYIQAAITFFQSKFQQEIERAITEKPAITRSLGLEKLRELKAELKDLMEKTPEIVSAHLSKKSCWNHKKSLPPELDKLNPSTYELTDKPTKNAEEELREIMGYVGELILKYGFDQAGRDTAWEARVNKPPLYRYGIAYDAKELNTLKEEYKKLFKQYVEAHIKLKKLAREKEEAIAKDLWNQA